MAALLGALVVWVPLLTLALTMAVCAVAHAWQTWQRVQRARRAAWWAAHPYDRGEARALDAIAYRNGQVDTHAEYGRYEH